MTQKRSIKTFTVPIYGTVIAVDRTYKSDDKLAIVETPPLALKYDPKVWDISVMAHECVHLVNFLLASVGMGMPKKDETGIWFDDEYYSYLYAYIFRCVYELTKKDLKEFKKKCKKSNTLKPHGVVVAGPLSQSSTK